MSKATLLLSLDELIKICTGNMEGTETQQESAARKGQYACILTAASLSLSVGPRTTLQDIGAFLPDHMAPNSLQGPDNTGEMTEQFPLAVGFRIVNVVERSDRMEEADSAAVTQVLKARRTLFHQGPQVKFREVCIKAAMCCHHIREQTQRQLVWCKRAQCVGV